MVAGHGIAPCPSGYEPDVLLLHSPAGYMAGVDGNAPSNLVLETGRHPYGTPILAETEGFEPSEVYPPCFRDRCPTN